MSSCQMRVGTSVLQPTLWEMSQRTLSSMSLVGFTSELCHEKTCFMTMMVNNKGTDQLVNQCSLTSTFVVCCLDRITHFVSVSEISRLLLVFVANRWIESCQVYI